MNCENCVFLQQIYQRAHICEANCMNQNMKSVVIRCCLPWCCIVSYCLEKNARNKHLLLVILRFHFVHFPFDEIWVRGNCYRHRWRYCRMDMYWTSVRVDVCMYFCLCVWMPKSHSMHYFHIGVVYTSLCKDFKRLLTLRQI